MLKLYTYTNKHTRTHTHQVNLIFCWWFHCSLAYVSQVHHHFKMALRSWKYIDALLPAWPTPVKGSPQVATIDHHRSTKRPVKRKATDKVVKLLIFFQSDYILYRFRHVFWDKFQHKKKLRDVISKGCFGHKHTLNKHYVSQIQEVTQISQNHYSWWCLSITSNKQPT